MYIILFKVTAIFRVVTCTQKIFFSFLRGSHIHSRLRGSFPLVACADMCIMMCLCTVHAHVVLMLDVLSLTAQHDGNRVEAFQQRLSQSTSSSPSAILFIPSKYSHYLRLTWRLEMIVFVGHVQMAQGFLPLSMKHKLWNMPIGYTDSIKMQNSAELLKDIIL